LQNVIIPKWKKLGLLKEVIITQSDLKDSVQIQQMRQLVDKGVDALLVCCGNPTALNQTIKYAYDRGVPTFSFVGYVTSPYAVSSSANFVVGGYKLGKWMAEELKGEGNVLIVEGIPGTSASDSQDRGIKIALKEYPGIKIAGEVAGMWTDQVAQAEIQKWLGTHPGKLDGIIIQCASELGAIRALKQSGRPMVPITVGGEVGALCYWYKHPEYVSGAYHAWPPGDGFELGWDIMMRTLQGQGPKIQSILTSAVYWTLNDLKANMKEDCSEDSDQFMNVGIDKWADKNFLDNFFLRPADPEKYKP
jgi:ribose transport system substrate-binding protein